MSDQRLPEDDVLVYRALAAGWAATVREFRIEDEAFVPVWIWTWEPPQSNEDRDHIEVWVSIDNDLRPALDAGLRAIFRELDEISPAEINARQALAAVVNVLDSEIAWLVDASRRDRVFADLETAYAALGATIPKKVRDKLQG